MSFEVGKRAQLSFLIVEILGSINSSYNSFLILEGFNRKFMCSYRENERERDLI